MAEMMNRPSVVVPQRTIGTICKFLVQSSVGWKRGYWIGNEWRDDGNTEKMIAPKQHFPRSFNVLH